MLGLIVVACVQFPPLGIGLLFAVSLLVVRWKQRGAAKRAEWTSSRISDVIEPPHRRRRAVRPNVPAKNDGLPLGRGRLAADSVEPEQEPAARPDLFSILDDADPTFSRVLFEDFAYALYASFQRALGDADIRPLRPYLDDAPFALLEQSSVAAVRNIVIGSFHIDSVCRRSDEKGERFETMVSFESSLTTESAAGATSDLHLRETWLLRRDVSARSHPPERVAIVQCPNCGGSLAELDHSNICAYCKEVLTPGRFDWCVATTQTEYVETLPDLALGDHAEERGNELTTRVRLGAEQRYKSLLKDDPGFTWLGFQTRVTRIFESFHEGWSSQDLLQVRPYLSDALFQMQQYWIESYRAQKLVNKTAYPKIISIQIADAVRDPYFDAITLRLFATCVDYTTDERDSVVGGSKTALRAYSEYWTCIRGRGLTTPSKPADGCPSCGADLEINMAGNCAFCSVRVTRGEFDWVLSRIEQDEDYV